MRLHPRRFFSGKRRPLPCGGAADPAGLTCPNVDDFLFLPVALGYWQQHELWDGTYTLDDLLDITEVIAVQRESRRRAVNE